MASMQWGQYAPADKILVHLSDTHFLADAAALYGTVDTDTTVHRALEQLHRSGIRPDALIITGDVADRGEADAYRRIRGIVEAVAAQWQAKVIWVMGNHDQRAAFRSVLLGQDQPGEAARAADQGTVDQGRVDQDPVDQDPVDQVHDLDGLRIIALDTSVPGYHHGEVTDAQLEWLRTVLSTPARHGSILALHHPPIPTPLPLMSLLELQEQPRLAAVLDGSDVRAILGGHLHYATQGLFAGIPVSVAAATCYTMDLSAPERELTGVKGGRTVNLLHVYADQITHSQVPIGAFDTATHFPADYVDRLAILSPEARLEAFSRQQ
ncbi:phosphodiesterase [Cryobacterium levicorallinum]|uniref:Calcineurin-like phosphoesterase n=1 Tax=Cryobacterium levicorallinum TaxID=995038 RepID=A0A1I3ABG5_9MICO|nr:phosphodiesterase [Cryobacterium levicorallinum]TFB86471.1 phosphodiesterase [Cryobacterium levicorallinum]SFH47275.1 Calcineurin-like phosphoesterase [Cryobacterium levicorallinum]